MPSRKPVNIYIGEKEWRNYSLQNKIRLLYRLRQSSTDIARALEPALSLLIQEEQNRLEIDYEATYQKFYEGSE